MADNGRNRWNRLPKIKLDSRTITKHVRKVENATVKHAHKFVIKRWGNVHRVKWRVVAWMLTMGILIAATGLQLIWYQQNYRIVTYANDGTYAEAVLGPIDTLNPLFASTSAERSASYLMFSSLLHYDTTGNLNYDLATNLKINDTNNIYTVSIRPDAKWHDGISLNANDIAFTIDLIKNPNVHSTITGWDKVAVKVINDTTIEFTLQSTYSAFEHALTFPILPKHILSGVATSSIRENEFSQSPIGSGPFKFSLVQDQHHQLRHHQQDSHWRR